MARYKLPSLVFQDQSGNIVVGGACSVFLAGTSQGTAASIYTASSGGSAVNSVTSDSAGQCTFYVDTNDYNTDQKFDVVLSETNFTSKTYIDIVIYPDRDYKYVANASASDQGVDAGGNSVKDLVDEIGSDVSTILMNDGTYTFTTTETIPSNITLKMVGNSQIDGTLIINGKLEVEGLMRQIFVSGATITFGAIRKFYPEWWTKNTTPGTTDMATAVQAAMDAAAVSGGTVLITDNCAVGSASWTGLTLTSKSNVTIMGRSRNDILKVLVTPSQTLSSYGVGYFNLIKLDTCTFVNIKNLTINLNGKNTIGIGMDGCTSCTIEGNYIYNSGTGGVQPGGVYSAAGNKNKLLNNEIYQCEASFHFGVSNSGKLETNGIVRGNICDQTGITSGSNIVCVGDQLIVSNNQAINSDGSGINISNAANQASSNVTITGNYCGSNFTGIDFDVSGAALMKGCTITGNVCEDNQGNGISLRRCEDVIVTGNIVRDNNQVAGTNPEIFLTSVPETGNDVKNINISGNTITNSGGDTPFNGIEVDTAEYDYENIVINNNIIKGMSNYGINLKADAGSTSKDVSVVGNNITQCGSWGIVIAGTWTSGLLVGNYVKDNDQDAGGKGDITVSSSVTAGAIKVANNKTGIGSDDYYINSVQAVDGYLDVDNANAATSGTGEDTLKTTVIPANLMALKGGIRIKAAGTIAATNDTKTIKFYFGTTSITMVSAGAGDTTDWVLDIEVWNTATNAQRIVWRGLESDGTTLAGYDTDNEDTTAAVTIKLTGECANASDTITQTMWIVEIIERTNFGA